MQPLCVDWLHKLSVNYFKKGKSPMAVEVFSILIALAMAFQIGIGIYVSHKFETSQRTPFLSCILVSTVFLLGVLLEIQSTTIETMIHSLKVMYTGYIFLSPVLLIFVASFCEIKLNKPLVVGMIAFSYLCTALIWSNESHNLIFTSIEFRENTFLPSLVQGRGIIGIKAQIYSVLCIAVSATILLYYRLKHKKKNAILIEIALYITIVANIAFLLNPWELNINYGVFAACIFVVFTGISVMRNSLFNDIPARIILDSVPWAINIWDNKNNLIKASQYSPELFGFSGKDACQQYTEEFFNLSPEYQPCGTLSSEKSKGYFHRAYTQESDTLRFEWMHQTIYGEPLPCDIIMKRIIHKGKPMLLVFSVDLRKIKKAYQQSLAYLDNCPLIIEVWDEDRNFIDVNQRALELFGLEKKEDFAIHFNKLSPLTQPCGTNSVKKAKFYWIQAVTKGIVTFEWMHKKFKCNEGLNGEPCTGDGNCQNCENNAELLPVETTIVRVQQDEGKNIYAVYNHDLREVKKAIEEQECALATAQEAMAKEQDAMQLNRLLYNANPIGASLWNENLTPIECNDEIIKLLKLKNKSEYLERFYEYVPDANEAERALRRAFDDPSGVHRMPWTHISSDGESIPGDVTIVRLELNHETLYAAYMLDLRPLRQALEKEHEARMNSEIAKEESLAKTRFLARMSHEIRTPMNSISGITDIHLNYHENLDPEIEEAFMRIRQSSDHLLAVINDILDFAKIESGKMEINPDEYSIIELISETVSLNMAYDRRAAIRFELNVDKNLPQTLYGDDIRIKQILNNLLSNAFKYTYSGLVSLSVSLEAAPNGNQDMINLVLRIKDTGQGMNEEQIESLFGEYARFNTTENRSVEGAGLGMTIVNNFVTLMDGTIDVKSVPDIGTSVAVILPQKVVCDEKIGVTEVERLKNFRFDKKKSIKNVKVVPKNHSRVAKILIVDDVETNLFIAKGLIKSLRPNFIIDEAMSGFEALEKITEEGMVYDLIFMDHMMPDMDGIETVRQLRSAGYSHPISALTANAVAGMKEMFLVSGFDDFISKPINIQKLDEVIERFTGNDEEVNQDNNAEITVDLHEHFELNVLRELFAKDARKVIEDVEGWLPVELNILKNFITSIHGIKAAIHSVGEEDLFFEAQALVDAGRQNNIEFINQNTANFLQNLKDLLVKFDKQKQFI